MYLSGKKLKEANKELFHEKEETRVIINPEDGYIISGEDFCRPALPEHAPGPEDLTPINGTSKFTNYFLPEKTQKIISNLLRNGVLKWKRIPPL